MTREERTTVDRLIREMGTEVDEGAVWIGAVEKWLATLRLLMTDDERDVTEQVKVRDTRDWVELLRCVCGQPAAGGYYNIPLHDVRPLPCCGRVLTARDVVTVIEVDGPSQARAEAARRE